MKKIIDVSYAQGFIDWNKAKKEIDGAILRCGYGSDMVGQDDDQWLRNVSECERLGIPYGVYLYSYAKNDASARSEAAHAIRLLKGHRPVMPVYFDSEQPGTQGIARACAQTFYDLLKKAGYMCGLYASESWYNSYLKGMTLDSLWIARYNSNNGAQGKKPEIGRAYDLWQYTSVGRVTGIVGNVDMNVCYRDFGNEDRPINNMGMNYRAHIEDKGWLPSVHDGMIAGTVGKSKRMEAIKITPPTGVELEVDAHLQGKGWKTYKGIKRGKSSGTGSSENDPIIGSVGESRRLEAIRIRCTKNSTGKRLRYQAHVQGSGWLKVVGENDIAGTTSQSKRMEAIRIWFE